MSGMAGVVGMDIVGPVVVEAGPSNPAEAASTVYVHRVGWTLVAQS